MVKSLHLLFHPPHLISDKVRHYIVKVKSVSFDGVFRFILRIGYLRGITTFSLSVKLNLDNVSLISGRLIEIAIKIKVKIKIEDFYTKDTSISFDVDVDQATGIFSIQINNWKVFPIQSGLMAHRHQSPVMKNF